MNSSGNSRLVQLAILTAVTVLAGSGQVVLGQGRPPQDLPQADSQASASSIRLAQAIESAVPTSEPAAGTSIPTPAVDTPSPAEEAELFPLGDSDTPAMAPLIDQGNWGPGMGDELIQGDVSSMPMDDPGYAQPFDDGGYDENGDPAPVYSSGSWFAPGRMFWTFDSIWWTKDDPRPLPLAREGNGILLQYDTNDVHQRFTPGMRTSLGTVLGRDAGKRDHILETEFQGLLHWQAGFEMRPVTTNNLNTQLNGGFLGNANSPLGQPGNLANNLGVPGQPVAGFDAADRQTYEYTSDFNSFCVNYKIRTRPGRDQMVMQPNGEWVRFAETSQIRVGLAGLKMIFLNESAIYTSRNAANTTQGFLRVDTDNTLVGPQYGLDFSTKLDDFSFGFRGRLGGLINFGGMDATIITVNGVPNRSTEMSETQFAFQGETGMFAAYHFRPNFVLRAGYDFMYLTGLSLAAENLSLTATFPPQNISGDVLLHGGSIGFESYW